MKTTTLATLTLLLAFLGIADAWYLTESAYTGTPLTCDISGLDGCNTVAQSSYSHLLGYPLALYGVFFFSLLFVLAAVALFAPRRTVYFALKILGIIGLVASLIFICIQLFLIKAVCVYCFGSAFISLFIFLCTRFMWRRERNSSSVPAPLGQASVLP